MSGLFQRFCGAVSSPDQIEDRRPRTLYEFWAARRGNRQMPARADFLAEEFGPWMPHLALYEIERHPFRLKVRLSGTAVVRLDGRDMTGGYLDEGIPPDRYPEIYTSYRICATDGLPFYDSTEFDPDDDTYDFVLVRFRYFRKLLLPLSASGKQVDIILTALYADYDSIVDGVERPLREIAVLNGSADPTPKTKR